MVMYFNIYENDMHHANGIKVYRSSGGYNELIAKLLWLDDWFGNQLKPRGSLNSGPTDSQELRSVPHLGIYKVLGVEFLWLRCPGIWHLGTV